MNLPFRRHILMRLGRSHLDCDVDSDIDGVIYAPGLVCVACKEPLDYGLVYDGQILGRECVKHPDNPKRDPKPWLREMDKARYYSHWSEYQAERLGKPKDRTLLRQLSLMNQMVILNPFLSAMQRRLLDGNSLSKKQNATSWKILGEKGYDESYFERRSLFYRLGIMELLHYYGHLFKGVIYPDPFPARIKPEDWLKLESLAADLYYSGLTEKQVGMLYRIEEKYWSLRVAYTTVLAKAFARSRHS